MYAMTFTRILWVTATPEDILTFTSMVAVQVKNWRKLSSTWNYGKQPQGKASEFSMRSSRRLDGKYVFLRDSPCRRHSSRLSNISLRLICAKNALRELSLN